MRWRGPLLLLLLLSGCSPRGPARAPAELNGAQRRPAGDATGSPGGPVGAAARPGAHGWWSAPPRADGDTSGWGLVQRPEPGGSAAAPTPIDVAGPAPTASGRAVASTFAPSHGDEPAAECASPPVAAGSAEHHADEEEEIEDDVELPERAASASASTVTPRVPPLSDAELRRQLERAPEALGPLSIGAANGGALFNALRLPESALYDIIDPGNAWATRETIDYLTAALRKVHERFPDVPKMQIGHLSAKQGGPLRPHRSHQSGRDVDTSFFYSVKQPGWYRRATAENLDRARTWAFVRALLTETDVEYIFINSSIQLLLKEHALAAGEDATWLDSVFQVGSKCGDAIIRHAKGHDTHIHVRFYNPVAQELGRRAYGQLLALGRIKPAHYFVSHRAVKGDTLGSLARRYGTTVAAIQHANGLRGTAIIAKQIYRIPKERASVPPPGPVLIPPRRLPPDATRASALGSSRASAASAP